MVRKSRKGSKSRRRQRGGDGDEDNNRLPGVDVSSSDTDTNMGGGGSPSPWSPGAYNLEGAPMAKSQYYTINGGGRRRRRRRSRRLKKGGNGVIATAAVPFGLLALQRFFKGSKTSKQGVAKMGRTFKRTFRRHRGGSGLSKMQALSASTY